MEEGVEGGSTKEEEFSVACISEQEVKQLESNNNEYLLNTTAINNSAISIPPNRFESILHEIKQTNNMRRVSSFDKYPTINELPNES